MRVRDDEQYLKLKKMMSIEGVNTESFFNNLRKKEYARLDEQGHVYLDYTGDNLYPQSLLDMHYSYLQKNIYGNPHSANPASLTNGLNFITDIGMENISRRIKELSLFILSEIKLLHHDNGLPLIKLYGPKGIQNRGGNFFDQFF